MKPATIEPTRPPKLTRPELGQYALGEIADDIVIINYQLRLLHEKMKFAIEALNTAREEKT